jgi:two-component system CheB/CheR fusion protein
VKRDIRESCIFSTHSFIKDPPLSRLGLISCPNVMIYLGPDLQRKIIPLFHYALRSGGSLFLGPSENATGHLGLFRALDKKHRIFQKVKESLPRPVVRFPLADSSRAKQPEENQPEPEERNLPKQLERIILQRYRPACITVQENGDAVYFSGRTSRYVEQPTGSPESNVVNMVKEGLRIPLRTALHHAATTHERAIQKDVSVQTNGGVSSVDITVEPLREFQPANLYMIVFEDAVSGRTTQRGEMPPVDASSEEMIRHLESELRAAQEHAQAAFEELETSSEELKSANEEYQSTNEELETSKEELQSFNEELETVNTELNRKVAELDKANSDLQNLLESTQIATIFLDGELHIKSFTPAAVGMFRLIAGDVGQPITDLAARFHGADLAQDIRDVLKSPLSRERQLAGENGRHYQMRILPYRTVHNVIDGVVITFTDVTQLKKEEQRALGAKAYAENIVQTVREPLLVLDADLRVQSANKSFYETFRATAEDTEGRVLYELGDRQWDIPDLRRLLTELLLQKEILDDFQVEHNFKEIGLRTLLLNARIIQQNSEGPLILLAIEDITKRKQGEDALRASEGRYRTLFESIDEGFCIIEKVEDGTSGPLDFRYIVANPAFEMQTGVGGVVGKSIRQAFPGEPEEWFETYDAILKTGEPLRFERDLATQGRVLELYAFRLEDETPRRVAVIFKDITERKRGEELKGRLAAIVASTDDAIISKDLNGIIRTWNRGAERIFGYSAEEIIGKNVSILAPPERIDEMPGILERISRGERIDQYETRRLTKEGRTITISLTVSPILDRAGRIIGASKIVRDISEQKLLEEALRQSKKELESLNSDLKHFSYAASHDLQAPLRIVANYTQLLARKYKDKLDPQADQFIDYAVQGVERMEAMLSSLREYWSVSEQERHQPIPIDCNGVLEKALDVLGVAIQESGGVVTHDPLPTIMAEEVPLVLLFQNLIGNALKYHRPGEPPRVHVSAQPSGNVWTFSVADNGLGIEAAYLETIFAPFKRLHGSEHPGSGIGLAICQKIVERKGGRIWAESEYGQGSTLRFTIPG